MPIAARRRSPVLLFVAFCAVFLAIAAGYVFRARTLSTAEAALPIHVKVAQPPVVLRTGVRDQQKERVHLRAVPVGSQKLQRVRRPVDPQVVAVHGQKRVGMDHPGGLHHPAPGF